MIRPTKLRIRRTFAQHGFTYDVAFAETNDEVEGRWIYLDCHDRDLRLAEAEELNEWLTRAIIWSKQSSRKKKLMEPQ